MSQKDINQEVQNGYFLREFLDVTHKSEDNIPQFQHFMKSALCFNDVLFIYPFILLVI